MNISNEYPVRIYKSEFEGNVFYSVGRTKKDQNGNYINGYMPCKFKKGVNVEHKSKIYIKNAWLTFYLKEVEKDGKKSNVTVQYIFVNDFEPIEETIENAKTLNNMSDSQIVQAVVNDEDPFKSFGEEVMLTDEDLPF